MIKKRCSQPHAAVLTSHGKVENLTFGRRAVNSRRDFAKHEEAGYSTVYLALATSIKAIYYPPVYSLTEGIVIAAPEFVLLGALSIAENAIQAGQKKWGYILLCICLALAGGMIATFVDIFLVKFTDDALKYLNFARCLVAVGFSIALGKLEGETTMIEDYPSTGTTDPSMGTTTAPESTRATSTAPLLCSPSMDPSTQTTMIEDHSSIETSTIVSVEGDRNTEDSNVEGGSHRDRIKHTMLCNPDANYTQIAEIAGVKYATVAKWGRSIKAEIARSGPHLRVVG